ncbi:MAG: putative sulfate/molybdate transporter [bacterium]
MEFAGALGDLGTLIPIFIALVAINGLNPTVILLLVGLLYISCGLYYNLPIPVQPLKAVAAIAIASGLSASVISAAGILMGIILLFLAISGLANFLVRIFNRAIVRGIQLGVGLMLIRTSWTLIAKPISVNSQTGLLSIGNGISFDLLVLFGGIIIMLIFLCNRRFPASTGILSFGIMVSILNGQANALRIPFFATQKFSLSIPGFDDFIKAFFLLVIPQLPLTLGNAIVATKDGAKRYFGKQAYKVTGRSLSVGMGITNIIAGLTAGMPVCHGSGGLTAHYRFGARTGGACIIIGSLFLGLSLIFGRGVSEIFKIIPHSILGIMLFYVGFRHALLITDLKEKKELLIALGVGIIALFTRNLAIAYGFGMILWYSLRVVQKTLIKKPLIP